MTTTKTTTADVSIGWGRELPAEMRDKIETTRGARAIFRNQQIDLLANRMTWHIPGIDPEQFCEPEHKAKIQRLSDWIKSKGLPYMRKEAMGLYPDENRAVSLDDGPFHIEASPQSSNGYLYIRAWSTAK